MRPDLARTVCMRRPRSLLKCQSDLQFVSQSCPGSSPEAECESAEPSTALSFRAFGSLWGVSSSEASLNHGFRVVSLASETTIVRCPQDSIVLHELIE